MIESQLFNWAGLVFMAGVVYSAIRVDLKHLHAGISEVKELACGAHAKIENHVNLHLEKKI